MTEPVWQNAGVRGLLPTGRYRPEDVVRIEDELAAHGALAMRALPTDLFPAAAASAHASGYGNVWVRDNVYVAYAHLVRGDDRLAARTIHAILRFWWAHRRRFDAIITGEADPNVVMHRPHVRFEGTELRELGGERWAHAQNDALGYALWFAARMAGTGMLELDEAVAGMLALLPRYLGAIRYWRDQDSGHWEETRKRSASSIGTVVAGLEALLALGHERPTALRAAGFDLALLELAGELERHGRAALHEILPHECVDAEGGGLDRRYDAALLFLVHPLRVISNPVAQTILTDIDAALTGPHGIRRYPGDSFWAPDYDLHLAPEDRTRDYSEDLAARDALLKRAGDEAQWCLFDPVLSAHYGRRYLETRERTDLERQVHHFERTLAQITTGWRCPELYYLKRETWSPGPQTPLLWTIANVSAALTAMHASAGAD